MTSGTPTLPTLLGLVLALGGPAVLASRSHPRPHSLGAQLADQFRLLALTVGVIAMVLWEHRSAASIGWHGLSGLSLAWGAALAFVFIRLLVPLERLALHRLDLGDVRTELSRLPHLSLGFLAFAGLVAGVAEETLFRGYAFTRIAELTGSQILAGLVTVAVFALARLRLGWGAVATFAVNGAVLTAFFAWRQDLLANITAHALTDVVTLLDAAARARRSQPD